MHMVGNKGEVREKGFEGCWEMWICDEEEIQALPTYIIIKRKRSNIRSMVKGVLQHKSIFLKYAKQI
jgi:hypothetical protein